MAHNRRQREFPLSRPWAFDPAAGLPREGGGCNAGLAVLILIWVVALAGCAAPPGSQSAAAGGDQPARVKKHLVTGMFSDPEGFQRNLTNPGGGGAGKAPGLTEAEWLVHGGLTYLDEDNVLKPRLADAVPNTDNGLWKTFPDGRMETTWTLRKDVLWQDGVPFTAQDVLFGVDLNQDKDIGIVIPPMLSMIERLQAPDDHTIVATWKVPFIEADQLFGMGLTAGGMVAIPRPKHLLAHPLADHKGGFLGLPYWREAYIGVGPYRIQEWVSGNHMFMVANNSYFLGRPKIDEIEIRLFSDINGVVTSLLAGTISLPLGSGLNISQCLTIRDGNPDLKVVMADQLGTATPVFPQFIDPDPSIISNVQFRRALLMAIDRQELNDTLNFALGRVAHTWLQTDRPEYSAVGHQVVAYDHDPRRAIEIIEGLGYRRGADGFFTDGAGQRLAPQTSSTEQAQQRMAIFPIVDYWKAIGIDAQPYIIPNALIADQEVRAKFPAFHLVAIPLDPGSGSMQAFRSDSTPLRANGYRGSNRSRYTAPDFDVMLNRYLTTIPIRERLAALGDILHRQTDQLTMMTLFYQASAIILGDSHLKGVTGKTVWNAHLWDLN